MDRLFLSRWTSTGKFSLENMSDQLLESRFMAESDKGTASSSKAKEIISVLDDDMPKNFLGSWNTILGAKSYDSSMDFKFESVGHLVISIQMLSRRGSSQVY